MTRKRVRRSSFFDTRRRYRQAEGSLDPAEAGGRVGAALTHEIMADSYDDVRRKHSHALLARLTIVQVITKTVREVKEAKTSAKEAADEHRDEGLGKNPIAVWVWLMLVSLAAIFEVMLGRYVVSFLAPDESDRIVNFATAGMAGAIYVVGHMIATGILAWMNAPDEGLSRTDRRKGVVTFVVAVAYVAFIALALVAAEAELGRWVLSYMALFISTVVQLGRPHRAVAMWLFEVGRLGYLAPRAAIHARRAKRSAGQLVSAFEDVTAFWAERMHEMQTGAAQFGQDLSSPTVEMATNHQEFLESVGLNVTLDDIRSALDDLVDAGVDLGALIPMLRKVA